MPWTTLSVTEDGAVLEADGHAALASMQGQLTGVPAAWWPGSRFSKPTLRPAASRRHAKDDVTLVTVAHAAPDMKSSASFTGVLAQVDVSTMGSEEFAHLGHLDRFEPDPVPLEREARPKDGDRL